MEDDVVLPDEVQEARVFALPPLLPAVGQELLRIGDIADGRIEPHVEHLALSALYGHGDTPVEVTAHSTGLQTSVEPALTLPVDIALPLLVVLEDPLLEEGLVLVEGQIPVPLSCGSSGVAPEIALLGWMRSVGFSVEPQDSHWSP